MAILNLLLKQGHLRGKWEVLIIILGWQALTEAIVGQHRCVVTISMKIFYAREVCPLGSRVDGKISDQVHSQEFESCKHIKEVKYIFWILHISAPIDLDELGGGLVGGKVHRGPRK